MALVSCTLKEPAGTSTTGGYRLVPVVREK